MTFVELFEFCNRKASKLRSIISRTNHSISRWFLPLHWLFLDLLCFVWYISFRFVVFRFVLWYFISFRFVSLYFVSLYFVSFSFLSLVVPYPAFRKAEIHGCTIYHTLPVTRFTTHYHTLHVFNVLSTFKHYFTQNMMLSRVLIIFILMSKKSRKYR
jgi:hypothetical protein